MSNQTKPKVQLSVTDGNVFALLGKCTSALKQAGQKEEASALQQKVFASGSYNEALNLMSEYCNVQ